MLEAQDKKQFRDLVTDDEGWFMLQYEHGAQLGVSTIKFRQKYDREFKHGNSCSLLYGA
jgi:hypothetical protein